MSVKLKSLLPSNYLHQYGDDDIIQPSGRLSLSHIDKLWAVLFSLAFTDVVLSYFGNALHLPFLPQPWRIIFILFGISILFGLQDISKIKGWISTSFAIIILSLLIGYFTIETPVEIIKNNKVPFKILPTDLLTMTSAFLIGAIFFMRKNINAKFISDLFLVLSAFHAIVCIIALLKISPSIFPMIDAIYYKDGSPVSRPEITTDQTRQALYLFTCLCVLFTQKSVVRSIASIATSIMVIFIITKVQSRWSTVVFSLFTLIAIFMAVYYKKLPMRSLLIGLSLGFITILWKLEAIISFLANLIWRFQQVDESYGGRMGSILYLFQKLADPNYWAPQGYNEFFQMHGAAPHSFPTMVYLNAGLFGLICYFILILSPLAILFKRIIKQQATDIQKIGFFCGAFAFLLSITQPVINHEIFWLMAGLTIGALCRNENLTHDLNTARQA